MRIRKIVGAAMFSTPFIGMFLVVVKDYGWITSLAGLGIIVGVGTLMFGGVYLFDDKLWKG